MHMLRKFKELREYTLAARDGVVGKAEDFYFDDDTWTVRYLVLKTSAWLSQCQVLISPIAIGRIDDSQRAVAVNLSIGQIRNSPPIGSDMAVSRQYENAYYRFYGWPVYWLGEERWGGSVYPMDMAIPGNAAGREPQDDVRLRNVRGLIGYGIEAQDGAIGRVTDIIVNDETWALRYLVVNARDFLPGKEVLVSPHWIDQVIWESNVMTLGLFREQLRNAPAYDPWSVVTRNYEAELFRYFDREDELDALRPRRKAVV